MKLNVVDKTGKKTEKTYNLEKEIFENDSHASILRQALHVHQINTRTGTAWARGRGDVKGTTRKPWANNKMSMARAGDKKSPIFRGGGVSHGPVPMNYSLKMPKYMKRTALYLALSAASKDNKILIVEDLAINESPMTKMASSILNDIKKSNKIKANKISIYFTNDENIILGFRNIKNVKASHINHINSYDIINADLVILFESAFKALNGESISEEVKPSKKEEKLTKKEIKK